MANNGDPKDPGNWRDGDDMSSYEDLRAKFDAEMRDRIDNPLKHMARRSIADELQHSIYDTNVGQPNRYVSVALLERAISRIRELERASQPGSGDAVAWLIDIPGEPELGHWFSEVPCGDGYRSRALVFADAARASLDGRREEDRG